MKKHTKIILSSVLGNALEFYDFSLYGIFAPMLALAFFPNTEPNIAILVALATFGIGYVTRPLGSIVLGHIGDKYGRKKALVYAIILMAIPTTLIGLLPSYQKIGIVAPIVLILCRLLQGLCAGGEYNGAAIFLIEHGDPKHRSFYSSLVATSGAVGALTASLFGTFLLSNFDQEWIWRLPFLAGALLGVIGYYIRSNVDESPEFITATSKNVTTSAPFLNVLNAYPRQLLIAIFAAGLSGTFSSALIVYINTHLIKVLKIPSSESLLFNSIGLLLYIVFSPITGYLGDRFGLKRMMTIGSGGIILFAFPLFYLLQTKVSANIFLAQVILAFFAAAFISPLNAFLNQLFPVSVRFSGVAFGSNFGKALLGGWMPAASICLFNVTGNQFMPAVYLMVMGALALFILRVLSSEKKLRLVSQQPHPHIPSHQGKVSQKNLHG